MKKYLFSMLLCLALFSVCIRPFSVCASGSSTCQVTATVGQTEPPQSEEGDPENPDPGKEPGEEGTPGSPEPSEEPGGPGNGEPDPGASETSPEPGSAGEATPKPDASQPSPEPEEEQVSETVEEPGEASSEPEAGSGEETEAPEEDPAREGEEPSQTMESVQEEPAGGLGGYLSLLLWAALMILIFCILMVLAATGVFRFLWTWLLFVFFRKGRRQFHGILTAEKSCFIRVRKAGEGSRLVQEIIDSTGSFAECKAGILEEEAVTEIPRQSRMYIFYTDRDGRRHRRKATAEEQKMFRILEGLAGAGEVEVRITCGGTGIKISLWFCV